MTEDVHRAALESLKNSGNVRGKIVKGRVVERPPAGSDAPHIDGDDLRSRDALSRAFQIARAAPSIGEHDKRITRSVDGAFEARRANVYDLSLCHLNLRISSLPRCFLSARDSEGVGALLAGTGLRPLTALWGVAAAWYGSAVMSMDFAECDRARVARDPSYDGRFFTGVRTTGVYCRPVCPVRPARSTNVQFFPSAAAAEAAGFRPCLRCRPETAPFSNAWIGSRATVERAVRLIVEEGALDEEGASVEKLAERLGMGRRQLARLFARHLKANPSAVARTARVQRAKRLIDETDKSMVEIAVLAGFGSLRRFNAVFAEVYGRTPTEVKRGRRSKRA